MSAARLPRFTAPPLASPRFPGVLFAEDFDCPAPVLETGADLPPLSGVEIIEAEAPAPHASEPAVEPQASKPAVEPQASKPAVEPPATAAVEEEAHRRGHAEGWQEGYTAACTEQAVVARQLLETIAHHLAEARQETAQVAREVEASLTRLVAETLLGLLPAMCAREGDREVARVMSLVLPALRKEPRIVLRVNPQQQEAARGELARLDPDIAAAVVLTPTDALAPGDVRITWEDGEAVRDTAAIRSRIAATWAAEGWVDTEMAREVEHVG